MVVYRATKKNRNRKYMNLIGSGITNNKKRSITVTFGEYLINDDFEILHELMSWLMSLFSIGIEYNKMEQVQEILLEHFKSLDMPDDLANKLVDNLIVEE